MSEKTLGKVLVESRGWAWGLQGKEWQDGWERTAAAVEAEVLRRLREGAGAVEKRLRDRVDISEWHDAGLLNMHIPGVVELLTAAADARQVTRRDRIRAVAHVSRGTPHPTGLGARPSRRTRRVGEVRGDGGATGAGEAERRGTAAELRHRKRRS